MKDRCYLHFSEEKKQLLPCNVTVRSQFRSAEIPCCLLTAHLHARHFPTEWPQWVAMAWSCRMDRRQRPGDSAPKGLPSVCRGCRSASSELILVEVWPWQLLVWVWRIPLTVSHNRRASGDKLEPTPGSHVGTYNRSLLIIAAFSSCGLFIAYGFPAALCWDVLPLVLRCGVPALCPEWILGDCHSNSWAVVYCETPPHRGQHTQTGVVLFLLTFSCNGAKLGPHGV